MKKSKDDRIYDLLRKDYLLDHQRCEASIAPICQYRATEIHHRRGRGSYYTCVDTFLAVCRACHHWIEMNPKAAKELGFSESRLTKVVK